MHDSRQGRPVRRPSHRRATPRGGWLGFVVLTAALCAVPLSTAFAASPDRPDRTTQADRQSQGQGSGRDKRTPAPTPTPTPRPSATPTPTLTPSPTVAPSAIASGLPTSGYSVATWGSDTSAGTLSAPWRTLQKAADSVPAGGTVYVRGGTYSGFVMSRSGTPTGEITFTEYPNENAVVQGDATRTKVIQLKAVHDVTISWLTVQGAPSMYGAGIYIESGSYDVTIQNNLLQYNRSFGVKAVGSTRVTIRNNSITKNETGVEISGAGEGTLITGNRIYANDRMIVNDATSWNDRGANAVVFYRTTGRITASSNTIYGNRAASHDYTFDGGAFEIYASSNITMTDNRLYDNENAVETGTDGTNCSNNVFTRNVAYKGTTTSVAGPSMGLILRCASNMLVANNSFYNLDSFAFDVTVSGGFAGSIDGLAILNNVARGTAHPYSFDTAIPSTVRVDYNVIYNPTAGGAIAYVYGKGNTNSLTQFQSWTGFDLHGIQADPLYSAPSSGNLTLQSTSPAIDRGTAVSGVTNSYLGVAPDIGRYETR